MPLLGSLGNAAEIAYGPPSDFTPDPFDFVDLTGIEPIDENEDPTVLYTQTVQITGIKSNLGVEVTAVERQTSTGFVLNSNYSNITYAITDDVPTDVTTLNYTNELGTIIPDQYLTLRLVLEPVTLPNNAASFDRDEFFFNDYNPRFSSLVIPESATEAGYNLTYNILLTVGLSDITWNVSTRTLDSTPLPFTFTGQVLNPPLDATGAGIATGSATGINRIVYSGNTATILGLETGYKFLLRVEPTSAGISVNEKVALASTEVSNGDIIYLKSTTPSGYSTSLDHQVIAGTFTTDWQIVTEDINLNITFTPEDFTSIGFGQTSTVYESNALGDDIVLSGFSPESSILAQVSGGTSSYYRVQRDVVGIGTTTVKEYEDPDIEVQEGDIIRLRMESSPGFGSTVTTTFTVGNTSTDWSITTIEL